MKLIKEELIKTPKESGIYLFTNLVNNKHYVGQALNLHKRLLSHLNNHIHNRYDNPLYRALSKYGIENFELEIIKIITDTPEEQIPKVLDRLEVYYIKEYNSYGPNGYNQTMGGDGGVLGYKMTEEQKKIIGQCSKATACDGRYFVYGINIETGEIFSDVNMTELAIKLNLNVEGVKTAKCKKRIYKGKYYFSTSLEEVKNHPQKSKYDHVNNCDDDYLIEYYNELCTLEDTRIDSIAKHFNLNRGTINRRNKKLREMGYELPINSHNKIKYVEVHNINSDEILHLSIQEIADKFNISTDSARRQIQRDNIYKKCYYFRIVYED